jgi:hypothetical protein
MFKNIQPVISHVQQCEDFIYLPSLSTEELEGHSGD